MIERIIGGGMLDKMDKSYLKPNTMDGYWEDLLGDC